MDPTGKISFLPPACVVRLMGQSMKRPRASLGFLRGSDQWLSRNKHDHFIRKLPPLKYASTKKKAKKGRSNPVTTGKTWGFLMNM